MASATERTNMNNREKECTQAPVRVLARSCKDRTGSSKRQRLKECKERMREGERKGNNINPETKIEIKIEAEIGTETETEKTKRASWRCFLF